MLCFIKVNSTTIELTVHPSSYCLLTYSMLQIKTIKFIKFWFSKIFLGGELYSGTVADFSGSDALIIKDQLRTEQYDFKHLNGKCFTE